jgi:hypothetical protein
MTNEERAKLRIELLKKAIHTRAKMAEWRLEHLGINYCLDCKHEEKIIYCLLVRDLEPGMMFFGWKALCLSCGRPPIKHVGVGRVLNQPPAIKSATRVDRALFEECQKIILIGY